MKGAEKEEMTYSTSGGVPSANTDLERTAIVVVTGDEAMLLIVLLKAWYAGDAVRARGA